MTTTTAGVLRASARLVALALAITLAACGGGGGGDSSNDTVITYDNHLPLQVGDRRVYHEVQTGGSFGTSTGFSEETVIETHQFDGATYHLAVKNGGTLLFPSWYAASTSGIRRYSGAATPWDLVRFPTHEGDSFVQGDDPNDGAPDKGPDEDFDGKPDPSFYRVTTSIVGIETVSTPAGQFNRALHVREHRVYTRRWSRTGIETTDISNHDSWYVPNVGQVRWETRSDGYSSVGELARHVPAGRPDPDTTPPVLVRVGPPSGTTLHPGAPLALTFSEPVAGWIFTAVTTSGASRLSILGPFDPEGRSVNLYPTDSGWPEGTHTVQVAGINDLAGNAMADHLGSTFTVTGGFALVNAVPSRFAIGVDHPGSLMASMNGQIDASTLTSITLRENDVVVPASVSFDDYRALKVTPAAPLKPSTRYTIDLTGLKDTGGRTIVNPLDWTFTTAHP